MKKKAGKKAHTKMLHGSLDLNINGEPAKIELPVPEAAVMPEKMLPVFRDLTNSSVQLSIKAVEKNGKAISCRSGCSACCRQLVPVSKLEAREISKLVSRLPAVKKIEVKKRFEKALEQLSKLGGFSDKEQKGVEDLPAGERHDIAMEYLELGIDCPFLENESCSIYEARPLSCREYLVTSPAENCSAPTEETMDMVPVSLPVSAMLNKLSAEILGDNEPGYIPLIGALRFAEDKSVSFSAKTGPEWMKMLMDKLPRRNQTGDPAEAV
ncbi:MAG: YkgJ family cysteine cluster protein [Acidobacteria bacterium]|nr:YkgJ family cysteine cluster protein [Acidobacteriota bacterium]